MDAHEAWTFYTETDVNTLFYAAQQLGKFPPGENFQRNSGIKKQVVVPQLW